MTELVTDKKDRVREYNRKYRKTHPVKYEGVLSNKKFNIEELMQKKNGTKKCTHPDCGKMFVPTTKWQKNCELHKHHHKSKPEVYPKSDCPCPMLEKCREATGINCNRNYFECDMYHNLVTYRRHC